MDKIQKFGRSYEFDTIKKSGVDFPVTSVVIPAYNAESTICRSLVSALTQDTIHPYEVVLVDDGSSTPIQKSLEFLAEDSRVSFFRQENKGVAETMNLACLLARGKYLLRNDADDELLPEAVQDMTDFLERHPDVVYGYTDGYWVGELAGWDWEKDSPVNPKHIVNPWIKKEFDSDRLLEGHYLGHARIYRIGGFFQVGGFNPELKFGEDWDFALKMSEVGDISRIPKKLHKYYLLDGGATNTTAKEKMEKTNKKIVVNTIKRRGLDFYQIPKRVRTKFNLTLDDFRLDN